MGSDRHVTTELKPYDCDDDAQVATLWTKPPPSVSRNNYETVSCTDDQTDGDDDTDDEEVPRVNLKVTPERDDAVFFTTLCVSDRCCRREMHDLDEHIQLTIRRSKSINSSQVLEY